MSKSKKEETVLHVYTRAQLDVQRFASADRFRKNIQAVRLLAGETAATDGHVLAMVGAPENRDEAVTDKQATHLHKTKDHAGVRDGITLNSKSVERLLKRMHSKKKLKSAYWSFARLAQKGTNTHPHHCFTVVDKISDEPVDQKVELSEGPFPNVKNVLPDINEKEWLEMRVSSGLLLKIVDFVRTHQGEDMSSVNPQWITLFARRDYEQGSAPLCAEANLKNGEKARFVLMPIRK